MTIAGAAMEIAEKVKAAIEQAKVIASTEDEEALDALIAQLKNRANDLAAQVEAS